MELITQNNPILGSTTTTTITTTHHNINVYTNTASQFTSSVFASPSSEFVSITSPYANNVLNIDDLNILISLLKKREENYIHILDYIIKYMYTYMSNQNATGFDVIKKAYALYDQLSNLESQRILKEDNIVQKYTNHECVENKQKRLLVKLVNKIMDLNVSVKEKLIELNIYDKTKDLLKDIEDFEESLRFKTQKGSSPIDLECLLKSITQYFRTKFSKEITHFKNLIITSEHHSSDYNTGGIKTNEKKYRSNSTNVTNTTLNVVDSESFGYQPFQYHHQQYRQHYRVQSNIQIGGAGVGGSQFEENLKMSKLEGRKGRLWDEGEDGGERALDDDDGDIEGGRERNVEEGVDNHLMLAGIVARRNNFHVEKYYKRSETKSPNSSNSIYNSPSRSLYNPSIIEKLYGYSANSTVAGCADNGSIGNIDNNPISSKKLTKSPLITSYEKNIHATNSAPFSFTPNHNAQQFIHEGNANFIGNPASVRWNTLNLPSINKENHQQHNQNQQYNHHQQHNQQNLHYQHHVKNFKNINAGYNNENREYIKPHFRNDFTSGITYNHNTTSLQPLLPPTTTTTTIATIANTATATTTTPTLYTLHNNVNANVGSSNAINATNNNDCWRGYDILKIDSKPIVLPNKPDLRRLLLERTYTELCTNNIEVKKSIGKYMSDYRAYTEKAKFRKRKSVRDIEVMASHHPHSHPPQHHSLQQHSQQHQQGPHQDLLQRQYQDYHQQEQQQQQPQQPQQPEQHQQPQQQQDHSHHDNQPQYQQTSPETSNMQSRRYSNSDKAHNKKGFATRVDNSQALNNIKYSYPQRNTTTTAKSKNHKVMIISKLNLMEEAMIAFKNNPPPTTNTNTNIAMTNPIMNIHIPVNTNNKLYPKLKGNSSYTHNERFEDLNSNCIYVKAEGFPISKYPGLIFDHSKNCTSLEKDYLKTPLKNATHGSQFNKESKNQHEPSLLNTKTFDELLEIKRKLSETKHDQQHQHQQAEAFKMPSISPEKKLPNSTKSFMNRALESPKLDPFLK